MGTQPGLSSRGHVTLAHSESGEEGLHSTTPVYPIQDSRDSRDRSGTLPNPTGMAIHATNAGMPVQGKIPNSQPTKPCPNTSALDGWQLGVEAVLTIHVSGAWPIDSQGKEKPRQRLPECPTGCIISSGKMRKYEPGLKSKS
jgi:hypothetical protein